MKVSAQERISALEARLARLEKVAQEQAATLEVQFKRIAQLQAELDKMSAAWTQIREFITHRSDVPGHRRTDT